MTHQTTILTPKGIVSCFFMKSIGIGIAFQCLHLTAHGTGTHLFIHIFKKIHYYEKM